MKRKIVLLVGFALWLNSQSATAQQGFGTNSPAPSSVIDMVASDKGVLLPRVALTDITDQITIPSPADALTVFNTATAGTAPNNITPGYYYWSATNFKWIRIIDKESDVRAVNQRSHITQDAGLNGSEGISAGGNNNILLGNGAGNTGNSNIALGSSALNNVTLSYNIGIGNNALQQITGSHSNIAIGYLSATDLISGTGNIFIGRETQPNVSTTGSSQLNIGNWIYGNAGLIGLGTDAANPGQRLDVANGNLRVRDIILPANAGGATDKVVVADGTGIFKSVDRATLANNLYTTNGTLAASRVVTTNNNTLSFSGNSNSVQISNLGTESRMTATGTSRGSFSATGGNSILDVYADNNNFAQVAARGTGNTGLSIRTEGANPIVFSTTNAERMRIAANGKIGMKSLTPTEDVDIDGVARVRSLPLNGTANAISTTSVGGASAAKDQTFTATRTVVADANGVLGSVEGTPSQAGTSRVVLSASVPGTQNISNGNNGSVGIFSTEAIDVFNSWTNNVFTVPQTGLYIISMQTAHEKTATASANWFNLARIQNSTDGGTIWNNLMVDIKSNNSPSDVNNGNILYLTGTLNQGELIRITYICNASVANTIKLGSLTITKLNQ